MFSGYEVPFSAFLGRTCYLPNDPNPVLPSCQAAMLDVAVGGNHGGAHQAGNSPRIRADVKLGKRSGVLPMAMELKHCYLS